MSARRPKEDGCTDRNDETEDCRGHRQSARPGLKISPFWSRACYYRIGKGSGYGDREDEILSAAGLINGKTPRAALVHEAQLFEDFSYLIGEKDRKVNIITPKGVYFPEE